MDCDDWWYDDFLSERESFFLNKQFKFSYSKFHYFFQKSDKFKINYENELPNGKIYDFLSKNYQVAISGLIVSKDLLEKINYKTKLLAITHMSNVTGSITNFEEIKNKANKYNCKLL